MSEHTEKTEDVGSVRTMSLLFITVLVLLPFVMDFVTKLFLALGQSFASEFVRQNIWVADVFGYATIYLFMLFYLMATFEPLARYGYTWSSQYIGLAMYIGVGSGVVMYVVDRLSGYPPLASEGMGLSVFLGYLFAWVILPALTEETLFRGVIQGFYQRALNTTFTVHKIHVAVFIGVAAELAFHALTPMYYGATHGGVFNALVRALPQLVYVLVFGFISGVMYQRTKSLTGPLLIHALGNGTELLLLWVL